MAVFAGHRRRQAQDETSLGAPSDHFETHRRHVVTFVHDEMPNHPVG